MDEARHGTARGPVSARAGLTATFPGNASRAAAPGPSASPPPPRIAEAGPAAEGAGPSGTRERIQSVALELFAEQGYVKTSLREIAERLGVTKAALYYHFKSKEDIVASLVADYFSQIDELIAWGRAQPRTGWTRSEVLARYFRIVADGGPVFRMLQQNQASIGAVAEAKHRSEVFRERMDALVGLLSEPGAPLADQVRAATALLSVSFGCMFYADRAASAEELRDAVLGVALELVAAPGQSAGPGTA